MRAEKGLPPLEDKDDDDNTDIAASEENEDDKPIDILLNETAEILNDLITPPKKGNIDTRTVNSKKTAKLNNSL
jgi:hypothetical protein